ncbi:hypothetical protein [Nocardia tengchongensis]|uniref:hypothetical protein n=1 Tax=Nocardia tengchongensis TaxID=2055889 RepID=UPI0036C5B852
MIRTHAWLAKYLAYLAAYHPGGLQRAGVSAGAREAWLDYIGDCWDEWVSLYESLPSVFEPLAAADLDRVRRQGMALEARQLESLGFSCTTEPGGGERLLRYGGDSLFARRRARVREDHGSPAAQFK